MNIHQNSATLYKNLLIIFMCACMIGFPLVLQFGSGTMFSKTIFFNAVAYYSAFLVGSIIAFSTISYFGLSSKLGKTFLWLGIGMLGVTIGLMVWDYYELFLKIEVPYPAISDIFYLMLSPATAIALYYLISIYQIRVSWQKLILPIFTMLGWIIIVGFLNETPIWTIVSDQSLSTITDIFYLLSDGLTAGMAILFFFLSQGKLVPFFRTFGFGFVIYAIANALFTYEINTDIYFTGTWSDRIYILSGIVMTYAIAKIRSEFIDKQSQVEMPTASSF